jgi:hypothetical protein
MSGKTPEMSETLTSSKQDGCSFNNQSIELSYYVHLVAAVYTLERFLLGDTIAKWCIAGSTMHTMRSTSV